MGVPLAKRLNADEPLFRYFGTWKVEVPCDKNAQIFFFFFFFFSLPSWYVPPEHGTALRISLRVQHTDLDGPYHFKLLCTPVHLGHVTDQ